MNTETQIVKQHAPISLDQLQIMAKSIAQSGMFGVASEAQAMALMLLCQAEGLHPVLALRRYHIIEGKPAFRADALQGEFEKFGAILWHQRNETECAATFFKDKKLATGDSIERAKKRYRAMKDGGDVSDLAVLDEITIIRTFDDAVARRIATSWKDGKWILKKNWSQSPRQMLHARCLTEGVRAVAPGLIAGVYSEDEVGDFDQLEYDQPVVIESSAEENVRAATANRLNDEPAAEVVPAHFGDIICHVGKAEGEMLGRRVSEIHPNILEWLSKNYGDRWGNPPSKMDEMLKSAVDQQLAGGL